MRHDAGKNRKKSFYYRFHRDVRAINVITEGDSWLHLPIRSNIKIQLKKLDKNFNILSLDNSGDEAVQIMSGSQKKKLRSKIKKYGAGSDFLLFSGGGNDIVGDGFNELLQYESGLKEDAVINRINLLTAAFKELILLRDVYAPNLKIITHTYDYPIPKDYPINFGLIKIGPWMLPSFQSMGWTDENQMRLTVKYLIDLLAKTLIELSKNNKNFFVVDTRGTLDSNTDWGDEIHPTKIGFEKISKKIYKEMKDILNENK